MYICSVIEWVNTRGEEEIIVYYTTKQGLSKKFSIALPACIASIYVECTEDGRFDPSNACDEFKNIVPDDFKKLIKSKFITRVSKPFMDKNKYYCEVQLYVPHIRRAELYAKLLKECRKRHIGIMDVMAKL